MITLPPERLVRCPGCRCEVGLRPDDALRRHLDIPNRVLCPHSGYVVDATRLHAEWRAWAAQADRSLSRATGRPSVPW